jgi:hypothetical protein
MDIATSNNSAGTVSVLNNNGNGTFSVKTDYQTDTTRFIVADDFDKDNDIDIALANQAIDGATVLINTTLRNSRFSVMNVAGTKSTFNISQNGDVKVSTTNNSTRALQVIDASNNDVLTVDTTNGRVVIGNKPDAGGTTSNWAKVSQATAGTIAAGGTTNIDGLYESVVYNGSLYIGTNEAGLAEVYRYDGGTTWTKVSQAAAGTIAASGTTAISAVSDMIVYNGSLYIATAKANAAEVYRYDGGTTWTKVSQATAGTIAAAGTAAIDGVYTMAVNNGVLYIGTNEPNAAEVYRYDGGTTWTKVSQATAGTIANGGTAAIEGLRSMVVYNGSLYVGTYEPNAGEVYRYDGGTNWVRITNAAGQITGGGTASIDVARAFVHNGTLFIATDETGLAELYRYDGGTTSTKVSQATAGTLAPSGTSAINGITNIISYNGLMYVLTIKANAAEIYAFTYANAQSYELFFNAYSSNDTNGESNGLQGGGSIAFLGEQTSLGSSASHASGAFLFSHGITTGNGAYDVAEDYPTRDDTLTAGDIVVIDPNEQGFVKKSGIGQDKSVVGVYSSNPALRLSQQDTTIAGGRAIPVALAGRVPVKVTNENGPIAAGDYITMSATRPGYGMKATSGGVVVGKALASFDAPEGTVEIFINVTELGPTAQDIVNTPNLSFIDLTVTGTLAAANVFVTGNVTIEGNLTVQNITVANLTINGKIITAGNTPTVTVGTAAGTEDTLNNIAAPQATIEGNDTAGTITIVAGANTVAGEIVTITFDEPFGGKPRAVISAKNAQAAGLQIFNTTDTDKIVLQVLNMPQAGQSYTFDYFIVQ